MIAAALIGTWARRERRCAAPLVDLALLRNPAVAGANAVMLLGGIGMYLLLTLVTRYVQTPASAGYGFGADVFVAGLVLVPFSVLGFVGGKLVRPLRVRLAPAAVLAAGGTAVLVALALFALTRSHLWHAFAVMGLLGLGVGVFLAACHQVQAMLPRLSTTSPRTVPAAELTLFGPVGCPWFRQAAACFPTGRPRQVLRVLLGVFPLLTPC
ncbi:hypothetical protein [Streptomyces sp. NRRL S-1813]|uniref:hypothetical protein n=1 Tax=Streptomyces sp. NRRL S-1813 TaxID=1463888 RepID=UPI0004C7F538|nr:hypothetical protein [Streptomyces sp. NRRL S-1813]